jgi:hypothetical protein
MPRNAKPTDQLAFDEQTVEDPDVEAALEERQSRKDSLSAVRKDYEEANELALAKVAELELPEGGAARVGRFRIVRSAVAARSVTFETKATSRVRISLVETTEDGAERVVSFPGGAEPEPHNAAELTDDAAITRLGDIAKKAAEHASKGNGQADSASTPA